MVQFLPQAQIRAPRNVGLDQRTLADLGQAAQQFGLARQEAAAQENRQQTLAGLAEAARRGASTEELGNTLLSSSDPQLAQLGLRAIIQDRQRRASQANKPRRIIQDAQGVNRFVDDGSQVFPDVQPDPVKRFGKPPAGFRFTDTGTLEIIPGGPQDRKEQELEEKERLGKQQADVKANIVVDDVDRALDLVENQSLISPTTGAVGGQVLSNVGGTAASNLSALLTTVRSGVGFDRLQQMRDSSPTGGALGAINKVELDQLNAALGSLEQSQSQEQLADNLRRVKNVYLDIIHGVGNGPEREKLGFKQPKKAERANNDRPPLVPPDPPQPAIDRLIQNRSNPQAIRDFDAIFGSGSAQRILRNSS